MATERKALFKVEVVLHIPDFPLGQLTAVKLSVTTKKSFHSLSLLIKGPEKGKTLRVVQKRAEYEKCSMCVRDRSFQLTITFRGDY